MAWLVVAEALILSVLGALIGVGGALAVLEWTHLSIGSEGVTVTFATSPGLIARGFGIALGAGAIAGLLPALRSARAPIVASLRA